MSKKQKIVKSIIEAVRLNNTESITHCATGIRIVPKNSKQIGKLEETDLIKRSLFSNNQFQVFVQLFDIEEVYQKINMEWSMDE